VQIQKSIFDLSAPPLLDVLSQLQLHRRPSGGSVRSIELLSVQHSSWTSRADRLKANAYVGSLAETLLELECIAAMGQWVRALIEE
jgi:hypothetical protein